ncbi:MAG: GNAT family N-acetyltransferase [Actinomycetota bacterium]
MASRELPQIREATNVDVDRVLAFWKEASDHASVGDNPESARILLDHDTAWLLIAENDGAIEGTLVAAWDGWRGNFYRLAVRPDRRRRGIATALVVEGERRMNACGARRNSAMVEGDDSVATAFWRSAGYRLDPRLARYIKEAP